MTRKYLLIHLRILFLYYKDNYLNYKIICFISNNKEYETYKLKIMRKFFVEYIRALFIYPTDQGMNSYW